MRCDQILPYLPGHAGGDLRPGTARLVERHLASCADCREEGTRLERVTTGLRTLAGREAEPPPHLLEAVLESAAAPRRRLLPPLVPPSVPSDVARLLSDNRDAIAQAGATALVAAGAAYALYRALRGRKATAPATL